MLLHGEMRSELRETVVDVNDVSLNVLMSGQHDAPPMLFLHGFPEYSGMWKTIMQQFSDSYFCMAPDQRGYNLSSRPSGVKNYKTSKITADAVALCESLAPGQKVTIVAHDWGASIGYAFAMWRPDLVKELVVINGLHPATFQQAILDDPGQRQASQYFHYLRDEATDAKLAANSCQEMFGLFAYFSDVSWMTAEHRQDYLTAWSQPGAITAMLNWYRATPVWVPRPDEAVEGYENPFADTEKFRVRPRHLLIWGEKDPSCRPSCHKGLSAYCDDLTKVMVPDADHWIVGSHPQRIVSEVKTFLNAR